MQRCKGTVVTSVHNSPSHKSMSTRAQYAHVRDDKKKNHQQHDPFPNLAKQKTEKDAFMEIQANKTML